MELSAGLFFYTIFLFLTLLTAIISNFKNKLIPFAYMAIIFSLLAPLIHLIFSTGNTGDTAALPYLLQEFQDRNLWAVFLGFMYIFLTVWLVLFIHKILGKRLKKWYHYTVGKGKDLWVMGSGKIKELREQKSINKETEK